MQITIKVENMSKSYANIKAVDGLHLAIGRGEVFGLLGANGAGKSTAMECMLGTKQPDSGTMTILGMNPQKERKKLFEKIGVQFQEAHYQDKIKVAELCEVTASLYQTAADYTSLLQQFGLSDKLKNQVSELSGGQKQRLFIVLALIPDPEVVFLDELTTGLDARARRDVWKSLSDLKARGLTIVLTSHFSIGLLVGGLAPNMKTASAIASLLYFPMLIFSGATLPYEIMPAALQNAADLLPLTQGIKMLKAASLGLPLDSVIMPVVVMIVIALLCSGLSLRFFKWE